MSDYLNYRRQLKNEGKSPKEKKRVKIAPYSKKRQRANREYYEKSRPFWQGKQCAIRSPGCTGAATGIHHLKGKSSTALLLDQRFWVPACGYCNTIWVEVNHAEAAAKGFKLSRLKKDQPAGD